MFEFRKTLSPVSSLTVASEMTGSAIDWPELLRKFKSIDPNIHKMFETKLNFCFSGDFHYY